MEQLFVKEIPSQRQQWIALLESNGLRPESPVEAVYGVREGGHLIATASLDGNILKMIAVAPAYRGGGVISSLIGDLLNLLYSRGQTAAFLYTRPDAVEHFLPFGFVPLETVAGQLVFMERPAAGIQTYLQQLQRETAAWMQKAGLHKTEKQTLRAGAAVLHANPFTLGHQYLLRYASSQVDILHVFVLSDEHSTFPAAVRYQLVAAGSRDLPNAVLHTTGPYLLSAATFPAYFLPEDAPLATLQASLDAQLFRDYIAPALGISVRFVAEEPFSPTTALYNAAMDQVFSETTRGPKNNNVDNNDKIVEKEQAVAGLSMAAPTPPSKLSTKLHLEIIPRQTAPNGEAISASRVRQLLAAGQMEAALPLLPASTQTWLRSSEALPLLQELQSKGDQSHVF